MFFPFWCRSSHSWRVPASFSFPFLPDRGPTLLFYIDHIKISSTNRDTFSHQTLLSSCLSSTRGFKQDKPLFCAETRYCLLLRFFVWTARDFFQLFCSSNLTLGSSPVWQKRKRKRGGNAPRMGRTATEGQKHRPSQIVFAKKLLFGIPLLQLRLTGSHLKVALRSHEKGTKKTRSFCPHQEKLSQNISFFWLLCVVSFPLSEKLYMDVHVNRAPQAWE